jgi:uncharacterized membrane protein
MHARQRLTKTTQLCNARANRHVRHKFVGARGQQQLIRALNHARHGQIFYSMTDRSATRGKLDVLLVTRQQLDVVEANDPEDELPQDLRIIAPTMEGFLLFRALAEFPGEMAQAQARIRSLTCGLDKETRS